MTAALQMTSVHVSYPGERGLNGVSLTANAGEVLAVVGASGSGKTTLLEAAAGLVPIHGGQVEVFGQAWPAKASDARLLRRRVGLALQAPEETFFHTSVRDEIGYASRQAGLARGAVDGRVAAAAEQTGLPGGLLDRPPLTLSGGERRLAALAAVAAGGPDLLLLDEPTAGLAPSHARRVLDLVRALARSGCAVVVATHDVDGVALGADRVVTLDAGRVVSSGPPATAFGDVAMLDARCVPVPLAARIAHLVGGGALSGELSLDAAATALAGASRPIRDPGRPEPSRRDAANGDQGVAGPRASDGAFGILTTLIAGGLLGITFLLPVHLGILGVLAASLAGVGAALGTGPLRLGRLLLPVLLLGLVAGMMQVATTPGVAVASVWFVDVTQEGLAAAGRTVLRVAGPVLAGLVLLGGRDPAASARGMGRLLEGVPLLRRWTADAGTALLLTVRLIPMMRSEVARLERAQLARGVDRRAGGPVRRGLALAGVATPALAGALQHAERLAVALFLRGFTNRGAAGSHPPLWTRRDAPWLVGSATIFAVALLFSL